MLRVLIIVAISFVLYVAGQSVRLQCNNSTEVWTLCGCSESCADQGTQLICPTECPSTGYCACKEGFAKNSNGQCIPQSECPNPSGCPSGAKPPSSFCDPCTRATCPGQPGAECKYCGRCGEAKYFLNGQDVTRLCHQNQPECKPDEELRIGCGSACPPQCGDETMGPCMPLCQPKCICKYGLVRGPNGCIRREECKNLPKCDAIATCPNGTHCIDTNFGAQCVPDGRLTCAYMRCHYAGCKETANGPRCPMELSACAGMVVPGWKKPCSHPCQRCVPEPSQCFTTPCPQYRCERIAGCTGPPIISKKPGNCPAPGTGVFGNDQCSIDSDCEGSQKCCPNMYGTTCKSPIVQK